MSENSSKENENIKIIFLKYLSYWKYILLSLALCLSFAVIYLKFTQQSFKTTASLIVKDGSKNEISDQLSAFEGLGLNLGNASSSVENEIQLLKSRSLISKVVQVLKLNVNYYDLNTVNNKELFSEKPINITFLNGDSTAYQKSGVIEIKSINKSSFEILDNNRKHTCRFGSTIKSYFGDIIITPNENFLKTFHLKIT